MKTVDVSWGTIGYRLVGHGPALVLLNGGGIPTPSIDDWPPSLIARLARDRTVIAMDYEGIGRTTARPGPLTITRLADDTVEFLDAMHLRQVDVLGWSMGGFVAQDLAIRYPGRVRGLILCASALGDGTAKPASVSGVPSYPAQWLFPFDARNRTRANEFEQAVHSYPGYYEGPPTVGTMEGVNIFLWTHGLIPDGHLAARITAPTLIGGGGQDVLLPPPDTSALAHAIRHPKLVIYRDAGHGFLIQHEADWARRVDRFLADRR